MKHLNVLEILRLGAIGLGFLLALMSYRLLAKEQANAEPRRLILSAIKTYMTFALILAALATASEITLRLWGGTEAKNSFDFTSYLAEMRKQYANSQTPESFQRGELRELGQETLTLDVRAGACKKFLAVVSPANESELNWWTNGPGARDVHFEKSDTPNVNVGRLCTSDDTSKPATVGLQLKMTRGSGPFAIETYFESQRVYQPSKQLNHPTP